MIIKSRIPFKRNAGLRSALLLAVFLVSLFSLSAYQHALSQNTPAVNVERLYASLVLGRQSVNYYHFRASGYFKPNATDTPRDKNTSIVFSQKASVAYSKAFVRFLFVKGCIAYPIRHIYFSAVIG